jgi:phenylalanyl-tRNA synthetase alpha chain
MIDDLKALEQEALAAVAEAEGSEALEGVRIAYLGRKDGRISLLLRRLGGLPAEERPAVGAEANRVKQALQEALEARGAEIAEEATGGTAGRRGEGGRREKSVASGGAREHFAQEKDLTLPGRPRWAGAKHPVTQVVDEICDIFKLLGFTRARGPEAETEWYNFVALNTPMDHPAADEQDTLYLRDSSLLRSHTSPVQVRTMEQYEPPIRILVPGMCYRRDSYDATHAPAFAQIEGLVVDEGVSFVDFKATLTEFARRFWGPGTKVRFRPSFFPFTEPSAEVDVKRRITQPDGSTVETDWLEIMGAGMVDPAVLENVGYDPERYTGFAFGMGPGRIAMLKYGIRDIRPFHENDIRFLEQFAKS